MAGNLTVNRLLSVISVDISRKSAIIRNKEALFRKEKIEKLGFFHKISYKTVFIKQWVGILVLFKKAFNKESGCIKGIFLLFKKVFNRD